MTKFRFKNDLIWQLLCYFVAGFNTIFSIILAALGLYDEAFALVVATLLLGILICYRTRREIKMQIQETLDSNKGGKIIAEFVDPGRYLYKISIRQLGVIFVTKDQDIWYLVYPDVTLECYKQSLIIKSKILTPQILQIKSNNLTNKKLLDAGIA